MGWPDSMAASMGCPLADSIVYFIALLSSIHISFIWMEESFDTKNRRRKDRGGTAPPSSARERVYI